MLALCIVDLKGGHQLCGIYDKYFGVKRACISCYCGEDNLDNTNEQCIDVLHHNVHSHIMTKTSKELKEDSQHKLVNNLFSVLIQIDGNMVYGACVHQRFFISSMKVYLLNYLFEKVLQQS